MLTYKEYEKAVFDWLITKNQNDPTFTFSLRKNGSEGAELDYFGEKEKNNRFNTTFWTIPAHFPTKTDFINLFFKNPSKPTYYFQVYQTRDPIDQENNITLNLAKALRERLETEFLTVEGSKEDGGFERYTVRSKKLYYENLTDLFTDLEKDLETFISIVDEELAKTKSENQNYIGHRITIDDFNSSLKKLERRIGKDVGSSPIIPVNEKLKIITFNMANTQPLNQILYGPPGTGKTYSTVEYAYKIINGYDAFEVDGYGKAKQWFKEELAKVDSDDRQLDFITFHQNYGYEDFVMGIKPELNECDGLSFTRHEGIFYKICQRALENLEQSSQEFSGINYPFNVVFSELIKPFNDGQVVDIAMKKYSFNIYKLEGNCIFFKPFLSLDDDDDTYDYDNVLSLVVRL